MLVNGNFKKSQIESQIQVESQVLNTRLSQLIHSSVTCKKISDTDKVIYEIVTYNDTASGMKYYYLAVYDNNVYLSSSNTELGVAEVDCNANSFLAKYVSSVDISPSEYNCLTDNIEIIDVNINMEYGTVLSQLNQSIRLRNGQ